MENENIYNRIVLIIKKLHLAMGGTYIIDIQIFHTSLFYTTPPPICFKAGV